MNKHFPSEKEKLRLMSSSMPLEGNRLQNDPFVPESSVPAGSMTSPPQLKRSYEPHDVLGALDANYLHPCSLDNMDIQHRMTCDSILGHILCFMVLDCVCCLV